MDKRSEEFGRRVVKVGIKQLISSRTEFGSLSDYRGIRLQNADLLLKFCNACY